MPQQETSCHKPHMTMRNGPIFSNAEQDPREQCYPHTVFPQGLPHLLSAPQWHLCLEPNQAPPLLGFPLSATTDTHILTKVLFFRRRLCLDKPYLEKTIGTARVTDEQ